MLLAPLSESPVAQLARRAGRRFEGLYGITGGNPLFLTEVLAAGNDSVPATVRDVVLARAARLAPAARDIAELVCVVPGRTEPWLLEQTTRPDAAGITSRPSSPSSAPRRARKRLKLRADSPKQRRNYFGDSVTGTSVMLSTGSLLSWAALRTAASLGPS